MPVLALEFKKFNGLPLHPLLVHIPVMLVPLALIGALAALVRPAWRHWTLPVVAVLAGASLGGVQFAMMSGEGLQELNDKRSALIEHHAQLAEQARPMVFAFFVLAAGAELAYWLAHLEVTDDAIARRAPKPATLSRLLVPLCALSVVTGVLATTWVYRTGHTGAESVWKGKDGQGGKGGEARGDGG